ncbi:MAG: phage portal protein [Coriobacteriia bacterium]
MGYKEHLKEKGYTDVEHPMSAQVAAWWAWYTATHDWYSSTEVSTDGQTTFKVERLTIKPARMVCQEWASLIMNERTLVATEDETANGWLNAWLDVSRFFANGQRLVERSMGLGTAAWALRVEELQVGKLFKRVQVSPNARIVAQRFDARQILPLSYDEDGCTECAFVSQSMVKGIALTQLQIHRRDDDGTYLIETAFFDKDGRPVEVKGVLPVLETKSAAQTFALVRPGLENSHSDYSPFGVSVFDDAIGAVKLTDIAIDSMYRDIYLGQKMLFLDERMLAQDSSGNVVVPRAQDQQLFRKAEVDAGGSLVEEYNPDLRVEENRLALRTGFEVLGARCGLGADYFALEGVSGVKTATEVSAEDSDLFRNVRKHENSIAPAIQTIVAAALALGRTIRGESLPEEYGEIKVTFDDSILEDSDAQRKRDRADVAAQLMQPWEYRMRWYGEDEKTAKGMAPGSEEELPVEE